MHRLGVRKQLRKYSWQNKAHMDRLSSVTAIFYFLYSLFSYTYVNNGWHDLKFSKALKERKLAVYLDKIWICKANI